MAKKIDFINTVKGSLLEDFYPKKWDFAKIHRCCTMGHKKLTTRAKHWHKQYRPVTTANRATMYKRMGDAIADQILSTHKAGRKLAIILPVGPMGMYETVVRRIKTARVTCNHVTTFNMDEWSDRHGNSMPGNQPGGFEHAMNEALFGPLGKYTVPRKQRNFATKKNLPTYAGKIGDLRGDGAKLVTVYGVGRAMHIAFWEPQIGDEYRSDAAWAKQTHRIGQSLHPMTIEQNALTSFQSCFTHIPCFANTIGPGLFLQSDYCIGGADGGYQPLPECWQGLSVCVTLQYGPSRWIPATWMPTMPGRLFFLKALAGPLVAV